MKTVANKKLRRLLVYRFGQIGDTVVSLPALWHLRHQFPDTSFTLLSEVPRNGGQVPPDKVLPQSGLIQKYLKYHGGMSISGWSSQIMTALRLRLMRFDAMAYLLPSIRSSARRQRDEAFFKIAGIQTRLGFKGFPLDSAPTNPDGSLSTVPHEADALLARLAQDGLSEVPPGRGIMDLGLTQEEENISASWLHHHSLADAKWFALCHSSKWSSKCWPEDRYLEVVRSVVAETNWTPVIFGGADDRESGNKLIKRLGSGHCAAGELSVRESAAMLKHAQFYLGNDTGVMHLAAAVGTPCVAIFASIDWPGRWSPYGAGHEVLRVSVPCAGCMAEQCPYHNECLTGIQTEAVLAACWRLIRHSTQHR